MIQLRLKQDVGYLNRYIGSSKDAITFITSQKAAALGLYYNINDGNSIIWAKTLASYCAAMYLLP